MQFPRNNVCTGIVSAASTFKLDLSKEMNFLKAQLHVTPGFFLQAKETVLSNNAPHMGLQLSLVDNPLLPFHT